MLKDLIGEIDCISKVPQTDRETALEFVLKYKYALLSAYDTRVIGGYDPGEELKYMLGDSNRYQKIIDSFGEEFNKKPNREHAIELIRGDIGKIKRTYAARRLFLNIIEAYEKQKLSGSDDKEAADALILVYDLLAQTIVCKARKETKNFV